jgi:hypothetical protein
VESLLVSISAAFDLTYKKILKKYLKKYKMLHFLATVKVGRFMATIGFF